MNDDNLQQPFDFMNTNLFLQTNIPPNAPVFRNTTPDVGLAFLIMICLLIFIKLAAMAHTIFTIEYGKYQYRKYMRAKEKILNEDKLKAMYAQIRNKYNGQQLEFPFVKDIDDAYVAARYSL